MDNEKFTSITIDTITHKKLKTLGYFKNKTMAQLIRKFVDDSIVRSKIKDEIDGLIR